MTDKEREFSANVADQFNPPPDHRHTGLSQDEITQMLARYDWKEIRSPKAAVAVGDLNSDEVGSGARMNAGKPAVELVPVSVWVNVLSVTPTGDIDDWLFESLCQLADFQEGDDSAIHRALNYAPPKAWDACCAVFDYGRRKYAEWNWLKGMKWSVPLACAIRHVRALSELGEKDDQESGLPHVGHYLCNLVMLATYVDSYPDGDDRPPAKWFGR